MSWEGCSEKVKQVTNEHVLQKLSEYLRLDEDSFVNTINDIIFMIDEDPFEISNALFVESLVEHFDGEEGLAEMYDEWSEEDEEYLEDDEDEDA